MPSARTRSRGAFLNWRFAVNGIQNAECSRSVMKSARLFMAESRIAERTYEAYSFANLRGRNHSAHPAARRSRSRCRSIATRAAMAQRGRSKCREHTRARGTIPVRLRGRVSDDALLLLAEPGDRQPHDVAGLEEHRRLHAEAHAGWRTRRDDVARQKRHVVADVRNDLRHVEHHGARVAALHHLAVHLEHHV